MYTSSIPGTHNILKQVMEGQYARHKRGHACEKKIVFSAKATSRTDDTAFYRFVRGKYEFYRVVELLEPFDTGPIVAVPIVTAPAEDLSGSLHFGKVGLFVNAGETVPKETFQRWEISGKALGSGRYISAIPRDVSQESY
jgi:hypothetical protein